MERLEAGERIMCLRDARGSRFTAAFKPYQCKEMHRWASQEKMMKPMIPYREKRLARKWSKAFQEPLKFGSILHFGILIQIVYIFEFVPLLNS